MRATNAWKLSPSSFSATKRSVRILTALGTCLEGIAPMANPYEPPLFLYWPPITSWKCGTRRPFMLRLTPRKPVGHVVLATRVGAAAALDVQALSGRVELLGDHRELLVQLGGQAARGRDAEFAGIGARTRHHVGDVIGTGHAQARLSELLIKSRQIRVRDPAKEHVLLDREPHRVAREAA